MKNEDPFWERPLPSLTRNEWEALCDGCGVCCLNKIEDMSTGKIYLTTVACDLLALESCRCSNYENRKKFVRECIELTYKDIVCFDWLPETCAYVLRYHNQALPEWHYLICNDKEAVHKVGISMRGQLIHERSKKKLLRNYIVREVK